jgi:hypothetical protein
MLYLSIGIDWHSLRRCTVLLCIRLFEPTAKQMRRGTKAERANALPSMNVGIGGCASPQPTEIFGRKHLCKIGCNPGITRTEITALV